ncbi:TlpA family protein disulfide reductase [Algoriphagus sp.]|uniref:TlpA family protein disulfide reductase n=1 Tax=Algoriphagus sp. TaxID=1872435 RepID=UPI003F6E6836
MKKILYTCFLAYLCLIASTLTAQVADSPPGDGLVDYPGLPASAGLHRGGETRSDTLTDEPAPVTIYFVHRSPDSAGKLTVDLWDAEMYGLERLSNHQEMEVSPVSPHILKGLMPREERGYRLRTPSISSPSVLRLTLDGNPVLLDYLVSPGDSISILFHEKAGLMIYAGPSADKFRLQQQLQHLQAASLLDTDIGLAVGSEAELQEFLDRKDNSLVWDSLSASYGRKTRLIVSGQPEFDYMRSLAPDRWAELIREEVTHFKDKLAQEELQAIQASALGSLYRVYLGRIATSYKRTAKLGDPVLLKNYSDWISGLLTTLPDLVEAYIQSPAYRDYQMTKASLQAEVSGADIFETLYQRYPAEEADRLAVQYLTDWRRRLPDFEKTAARLQGKVVSPHMQTALLDLTGKFGKYTDLQPFKLSDRNGDSIALDDVQGNTVLMDFWITGCGACKSFHEHIWIPLVSKYKDHPELKIISVNADRSPERWESADPFLDFPGEYTEVHAPRNSGVNPFLEYYNIHSYPQLMLVRKDGTLFSLGQVPTSLKAAEKLLLQVLENPAAETLTDSSTQTSPNL